MKNTPTYIESFVEAARTYVKRALADEEGFDSGLGLDGSETSLAFVDHYIRKTNLAQVAATSKEKATALMALVAPALGAYFGEIAIAKFGGQWQCPPDREHEPADWRIVLETGGLEFSPVGMAAAALAGGDADGYDGSFTVRPDLMERLETALSESPPVDEDYYYSLTGRLETLSQVVELLGEIERQRHLRN